MDAAILLTELKKDLGISSDTFDARLSSRIQTAQERIAAEGATLTDSESDQDLVLMYAAYLWRSRVTGEGMPRMLRWALNCRILAEKAGGTT